MRPATVSLCRLSARLSPAQAATISGMTSPAEFQPAGRWVMVVDDDVETTLYLEMAADGGLGGLLESDNDEEPEPFTGRYTWDAPTRVLRLEFLFEGDPPESFDVRFESRTQDGYVAVDDEGTAYVFMPAE